MSKIKNLFSRFVYLLAILFISIISTNCQNYLSLSNAEFKIALTVPGECSISRTAKSANNSEWTVKTWIEQDDGVILESIERPASSGETVSFSFYNIPVGIQIRICAEIFNNDSSDTIYNGQTESFITQKGQNKRNLTVKLVNKDTSVDSEQPDEEDDGTSTDEISITLPVLTGCNKDGYSSDLVVVADSSSEGDESKIVTNLANFNNVTSVWDYIVAAKPDSSSAGYSFSAGNNTVSVQLKADNETVVGIAAARADMFFTVGTEWKTYSFQTGYLKEDLIKEITIGVGLSEKLYVRNLSVTPIEYDENQELPSLSIMISKDGIKNYLADENRNENIIDYFITENNSYSLGLNATGVTVELRSYVSEIGLNKASFYMTSDNQNLKTSVCANIDYAYNETKKAFAWNGKKTPIGSTYEEKYNSLLASYEQNKPCKVTVISESNEKANITISNLQIKNIVAEDEESVLIEMGKAFYIFVNGSPEEEKVRTVVVDNTNPVTFDVLIGNTETENESFDWNECVRFCYKGNVNTEGNLVYEYNNDNNNDTFKITNNSGSNINCKIELTNEYKVKISEVEEATVAPSAQSVPN